MTPRRTNVPSLAPRLRYKACAWKYKPVLPCTESLTREKIKTISLQMSAVQYY